MSLSPSTNYAFVGSYFAEPNLPPFLASRELLSSNHQLILALIAAVACFGIQLLSHQVLSFFPFYKRLVCEDKANKALALRQKDHPSLKISCGSESLHSKQSSTVKNDCPSSSEQEGMKPGSRALHKPEVERMHLELNKTIKLNVIAVSTVFSAFVVLASYYAIHLTSADPDHVFVSDLVQSRMSGRTRFAQMVLSIAQGYFLWDLIVCLWYYDTYGLAFLIHAVACLTVYTLFAQGNMMYYGIVFLTYEMSSLFLNWRSALKLAGHTGSLQYQAVSLVSIWAFFYARIYHGLMHYFFALLEDLVKEKSAKEPMLEGFYKFSMFCNMILNGLNVYWFSIMCIMLFKQVKVMIFGTGKKDKLD